MAVPGPVALLAVVSVVMFGAGYTYRVLRTRDPQRGPVESYLAERRETLRERYANGEISREQFAAEIETVEDPATERVMHLARDVDGIGPHIAFKIAREFEDLDDLAAADPADLEAVNRVGENRARALHRRARRERDSGTDGPNA